MFAFDFCLFLLLPSAFAQCGYHEPQNFKAFDLGNCSSQLTFERDQYVGSQWVFDAVYPDGSKESITPFRDTKNFGVSDTFYLIGYGNNYMDPFSTNPRNRRHVGVHEFSNVCKEGIVPVKWIFRTTSPARACSFTTSAPITVTKAATRPQQVAASTGQRISESGEYRVTWTSVPGAVAYTVIFETYNGSDEGGNPYSSLRGGRILAPRTEGIFETGTSHKERGRRFVVNAVNEQGVWSFTPNVGIVQAK